jgi:hypothetical protein
MIHGLLIAEANRCDTGNQQSASTKANREDALRMPALRFRITLWP